MDTKSGGEEMFYLSTPSAALWFTRARIDGRLNG